MTAVAARILSEDEPLSAFACDVIEGLTRQRKSIPSTWLYDHRGSELFEQITELPEYYPTRTEYALLDRLAPALRSHIAQGAALFEFGSGSSRKTRIVLDAMEEPACYVPIDIADEYLQVVIANMRAELPLLDVLPVIADFNHAIELPASARLHSPKLGFFPGSTIGNLLPDEAVSFLRRTRALLGPDAWFLVGVDLEKSTDILLPAYDDAQGVTAAFNKNVLHRANRELGADFDPDAFDHEARYDADLARIEMHLVSRVDQSVSLCGYNFSFTAGESIHTENSHKYSLESFEQLARSAGWHRMEAWTDEHALFSVHLLTSRDSA